MQRYQIFRLQHAQHVATGNDASEFYVLPWSIVIIRRLRVWWRYHQIIIYDFVVATLFHPDFLYVVHLTIIISSSHMALKTTRKFLSVIIRKSFKDWKSFYGSKPSHVIVGLVVLSFAFVFTLKGKHPTCHWGLKRARHLTFFNQREYKSPRWKSYQCWLLSSFWPQVI
jgi:hypothetical protein